MAVSTLMHGKRKKRLEVLFLLLPTGNTREKKKEKALDSTTDKLQGVPTIRLDTGCSDEMLTCIKHM